MKFRIVIMIIAIACIIPSLAFSSAQSDYIKKAREAMESKRYEECADFYQEAIKAGADRGSIYYDAASCYALAGKNDKAFEYLSKAMDKGYKDVDWLRRDPDLKNIHDDKRWQAIVARCDEAYKQHLESINRWLFMMYQADQNERANYKQGDDWGEIAKRDSLRRDRVRAMIKNEQLKVSDDYYHAAMIMHHGTDSLEYKIANELAQKAVELDSTNDNARWLIAASTDRYLLKVGKPQIYGTQYNYVNGRWTLDPIDAKGVDDAIREFYRVPSLEDQQKRVNELNGK